MIRKKDLYILKFIIYFSISSDNSEEDEIEEDDGDVLNLESTLPPPNEIKNRKISKSRSESAHKMLENLSDKNSYLKRIKSHDKNKLFFDNFANNIDEIDTFADKHFPK